MEELSATCQGHCWRQKTYTKACDYVVPATSESLRFVSVLEGTAKATTTLDLYSQAMDESKLAAQRDMARYYGRPAAGWIIQDKGSLLALDCLHAQFHFRICRMHSLSNPAMSFNRRSPHSPVS